MSTLPVLPEYSNIYWLVTSDLLMIMHPDECHGTSRMISQHWFRWWLGAVRQQAMTWRNVKCRSASLYGIPRPQWVNDALAPCIRRSSTTIMLNIEDQHVLAFHKVKFQLSVPSQFRETIQKCIYICVYIYTDIYIISLDKFSTSWVNSLRPSDTYMHQ